jgi:hypothetical protein
VRVRKPAALGPENIKPADMSLHGTELASALHTQKEKAGSPAAKLLTHDEARRIAANVARSDRVGEPRDPISDLWGTDIA